ncbi:tRNA (guanine(10)-N(2))-dimethyltransferase [Halobacteriales archaeon SW_7_68_16]|nr:MAG: tRNA (guanine(10)-N(2))-dimethyltransferase [Halobacteriales archaeon SW_7_68_16]
MRVREGGVEIEVPEQDGESAGDEVFYNPTQELNRDLTVAVLRAFREREPRADTYLDAMTASGIRAIRAADDGWTVTATDTDPDAVALARENAERNGVDVGIRERDARVALHGGAYDVVDLDPFGTPIPFADAALANAHDLVCVTATDTAPLCGAHFDSGVRRYGTVPRNTEFHAEMGLRVLVSALVRTAARYDVAATPLLAHATRHYVRVYLELEGGAGRADDRIDDLGHLHWCRDCCYRESATGLLADPPAACPNCEGDRLATAGPIHLGPTRDPAFLSRVRSRLSPDMGAGDDVADLLSTLAGEIDEPSHYDQHRLCEVWGRPATAMDEFLDGLRDAGYGAARTHYGGTTFETDADVATIRAVTADD